MVEDIIDVHTHIGISPTLQVAGSPEDVLRKMDANGISQAVISPIPGYEDPNGVADSIAHNDQIASALGQWPARFPRGLGVIEPRHGPKALPEVDRAVEVLGFAGFMFHNDFNGMPIDHPAMYAIFDRIAKHPGMICLVHTAQHSILEAPFQLGRLSTAYPDVMFINAHPFMDIVQLAASIDLAQRVPNMVFDTCLSHHHQWPIEKAIEGIGEDRLLFGSDNPYYDHSIDIDIVEGSRITEVQKDKVFRANARRLFNLEGPRS